MFLRRVPRSARLQWHLARRITQASLACGPSITFSRPPLSESTPCAPPLSARCFHTSPRLRVVKPVLLADIGEGIVECEIIQWFVEPGARVEEFSKLCEVQSDKASVEITSRFEGVVKKLYYEAGEMARVGKPFVDIDIQGHVSQEELQKLTPSPSLPSSPESLADSAGEAAPVDPDRPAPDAPQKPGATGSAADGAVETPVPVPASPKPKGKHASLATPAVRHLCKEMKIDILDIDGTGKDGRVLKEDIYRFVQAKERGVAAAQPTTPGARADAARPPSSSPSSAGAQIETRQPLTKTQEGMFKTMTRSLNIPHFLYADEIDFADLHTLRSRLNKVLATPPSSPVQSVRNTEGVSKLSSLPFIVKAVSIALQQYPILNARVDVSDPTGKPQLVYRSQHNIGVAMDTPSGLLVPVIKDVGAQSILTIAAELARLQTLAVAGKLGPQDLSGGTITVSNIGSIGGTYCSPVIVEGQLAILGVGRIREVPDIIQQGDSEWKVKGMRKVCNFSWSADHRVVDGATMARAAGVVRALIEEPDVMIMNLR